MALKHCVTGWNLTTFDPGVKSSRQWPKPGEPATSDPETRRKGRTTKEKQIHLWPTSLEPQFQFPIPSSHTRTKACLTVFLCYMLTQNYDWPSLSRRELIGWRFPSVLPRGEGNGEQNSDHLQGDWYPRGEGLRGNGDR
jgi:hypothetical protein